MVGGAQGGGAPGTAAPREGAGARCEVRGRSGRSPRPLGPRRASSPGIPRPPTQASRPTMHRNVASHPTASTLDPLKGAGDLGPGTRGDAASKQGPRLPEEGERHGAPFWSREPRIFSGVYYSCSLRFPASWLGSWIPSFLLLLFRMGIRDEYEHRVGRQMGRSGGSPVRTDGQAAVFRES